MYENLNDAANHHGQEKSTFNLRLVDVLAKPEEEEKKGITSYLPSAPELLLHTTAVLPLATMGAGAGMCFFSREATAASTSVLKQAMPGIVGGLIGAGIGFGISYGLKSMVDRAGGGGHVPNRGGFGSGTGEFGNPSRYMDPTNPYRHFDATNPFRHVDPTNPFRSIDPTNPFNSPTFRR